MTALLPHSQSLVERALRVLLAGFFGGVAATVLGVLAHEVAEGEAFEVSSVRIEGYQRANPTELRHLADIRRGQHLLAVDLTGSARAVARHPWVESATVRRVFPSTIEITVVEHQPVLLLALDALWYVDANGRPFRQAAGLDLDYPLLTGLDPSLVTSSPRLAQAVIIGGLSVLDAVSTHPDLDASQVSEVHYEPSTGYTLILRQGTRVVVGITDPNLRLDRLSALVDQGLDLEEPHFVDLDLADVAVVRPMTPPGS